MAHCDLLQLTGAVDEAAQFFAAVLALVVRKTEAAASKVEQATALWTIYVQKVPLAMMAAHLDTLLPRIMVAVDPSQTSAMSMSYGGMQALATLLLHFPDRLMAFEWSWGPHLVHFLTHPTRR